MKCYEIKWNVAENKSYNSGKLFEFKGKLKKSILRWNIVNEMGKNIGI